MGFLINKLPIIAIFAITFWCGITGRNRIGISLCLFFLPYNLFDVKGFGFNIFAIMGFATGYILKNLFVKLLYNPKLKL